MIPQTLIREIRVELNLLNDTASCIELIGYSASVLINGCHTQGCTSLTIHIIYAFPLDYDALLVLQCIFHMSLSGFIKRDFQRSCSRTHLLLLHLVSSMDCGTSLDGRSLGHKPDTLICHRLGYHCTLTLSPCPQPPTSTHPYPTTPKLALVHWPLCNPSLTLYTLDYSIKLRLHNDASNNHFSKRSVQCLEVEDEIELAYVLEQPV